MKKIKNKVNKVIYTLLRGVFIFLFLLVLFLSFSIASAVIKKQQPIVFGYMTTRIKSDIMANRGRKKGDYVVIKVTDSESQIEINDIVAFYVHVNGRPVLKKDSRDNISLLFYKVTEINGDGSFVVKDDSRANPIVLTVQFESIAGVCSDTGEAFILFTKVFLIENRLLYWLIGLLGVALIRFIILFFYASKMVEVQRQVEIGERMLLDRKCFEWNVFESFTTETKNNLVKNAPKGMEMLYEYLLFGNLTDKSNSKNSALAKTTNSNLIDVLFLTYAEEKSSSVSRYEYIEELPLRKKKTSKYRNEEECNTAFDVKIRFGASLLIGSLMFVALYIGILFATVSVFPIITLPQMLIFILPLIIASYIVLLFLQKRKSKSALKEWQSQILLLPNRYHFIINPHKFTAEEIKKSYTQILQKLDRSSCKGNEECICECITLSETKVQQDSKFEENELCGNFKIERNNDASLSLNTEEKIAVINLKSVSGEVNDSLMEKDTTIGQFFHPLYPQSVRNSGAVQIKSVPNRVDL